MKRRSLGESKEDEEAGGVGEAEEVDLKTYLPTTFGKKVQKFDAKTAIEKTRKKKIKPEQKKTMVGPPAPEPKYSYGKDIVFSDDVSTPIIIKSDAENDEEQEMKQEEEEYEEIDEDNPFKIPFAYEVILSGHEGIVSALGLDPSGTRLVSGGYDQTIKFWDFPAMDLSGKSFRSIEPPDDIVHTLRYTKTGDKILMAGSSPQARIYDRDGHVLVEFVKGYPYITDMSSTKGHVSRVTCAFWHPLHKEQIVTGSQDSSIRIWDVNKHKEHLKIIKLRNTQGASKAPVMACAMSHNGQLLVAAGQDGSLQIFPAEGPYTRPKHRIENAHETYSETADIVFKSDNIHFLTRGADDTLKIWDVRKLTKPLRSYIVPNKYTEANVLFSPDEKLFVAGSGVNKSHGENQDALGKIHFFNSTTLEEVKSVPVSPESVVSVLWHADLNQIIAGCCDKQIHVLYDPRYSKKGIMYSVMKAPKKKRIEDTIDTRYIMNPHALPMFKQPPSARRQREKARKDPLKAHIPEAPQIGPGVGGRLGSSLTASIMKNLVKKDEIDDDPRAALLKYATGESFWFRAYEKTQPKPIFENVEDEENNNNNNNNHPLPQAGGELPSTTTSTTLTSPNSTPTKNK